MNSSVLQIIQLTKLTMKTPAKKFNLSLKKSPAISVISCSEEKDEKSVKILQNVLLQEAGGVDLEVLQVEGELLSGCESLDSFLKTAGQVPSVPPPMRKLNSKKSPKPTPSRGKNLRLLEEKVLNEESLCSSQNSTEEEEEENSTTSTLRGCRKRLIVEKQKHLYHLEGIERALQELKKKEDKFLLVIQEKKKKIYKRGIKPK